MKLAYSNLGTLLMVALCGCSTASTQVQKPIDTSRAPTVRIRIGNDTEDLAADLRQRFEALGFRVVPEGGHQPTYYADVAYRTTFDVFHQTFSNFQITFTDATTMERMAKSRYVGRFGFNGINGALDMVFSSLKRQLADKKPSAHKKPYSR
jgi:hypothetical protein